MFDPEFLELMPLTCFLIAPSAANLYGETGDGGTIEVRCHIEWKGGESHPMGDSVRVREGTAYLAGHYPSVDTSYKLRVLQNGQYRDVDVIGVDQNTDEQDWHHTVVHFGAF